MKHKHKIKGRIFDVYLEEAEEGFVTLKLHYSFLFGALNLINLNSFRVHNKMQVLNSQIDKWRNILITCDRK